MEKITGKNNDIIKGVKKLISSSKERRSQSLFVLEGARLVFDVLNSFYEVKLFLITESALTKHSDESEKLIEISDKAYIITEEIAERLSDTQSSQGVFAICKMKRQNDFAASSNGKYIALDNVQDPGNLGAIVRTAEALGIDGIIVCGGCDIYNPKALRASMGSMLRMNVYSVDSLAELLKTTPVSVYGTVPNRNAKSITSVDFSRGGICVIGNEANGIGREVMEACDELVTIQMRGKAESLNASVAASITIWEMMR